MRYTGFVLALVLALGACDSNEPPAPSPEPEAQPDRTPPPPENDGLAGIWRSQGTQDQGTREENLALVLEDGGQLHLVGAGGPRGLTWEAADDDRTVTLHYLKDEEQGVSSMDLEARQDADTLSLDGDEPFAGEYRRDSQGVGHLDGEVVLPDDAEVPDNAVLAISLLNGDDQPVAERLTRLRLDHRAMRFRLYFDDTAMAPGQEYTLAARVISDGALHFTNGAETTLSIDEAGQSPAPVTLALEASTREE